MRIRPGLFLLITLLPIAIIIARASFFYESGSLQHWMYLMVAAIPFIWTFLKINSGHRMDVLSGVGPWWLGLAMLHAGIVYWKLIQWYIAADNYFLYRSLGLVFPIGLSLTGFPYLYNYVISKNFKDFLHQTAPTPGAGFENSAEYYKKLIHSNLFCNLQELNAGGKVNPLEYSVFLRQIPAIVEDEMKIDLALYMAELKQEYALSVAPNQANAILPN